MLVMFVIGVYQDKLHLPGDWYVTNISGMQILGSTLNLYASYGRDIQ